MFSIADALQPRICSNLLNSGRPEKAYYRRVAMYDWLTISSSVRKKGKPKLQTPERGTG